MGLILLLIKMDIEGDSKILEPIKSDKNKSAYMLFKEYNRFWSYGIFVFFINILFIWVFFMLYFQLGYLKIKLLKLVKINTKVFEFVKTRKRYG